MIDTQTQAENYARRRAVATGEVHLVVASQVTGQNYRVLTPADVLAEAHIYCLGDVLFTADPDQFDLELDAVEPTAA